jgi:Bacterial Ig-like domain (group 1)/PKD domain
MVFMITRLRRAAAVVAVILGAGLLNLACQKVPLLAPSGSTITLLTSVSVLPVNGSTDLIAQVIEASGTPPQHGTRVSFTTTLGTIQPSEADTDISGRVVVKFLAGGASGTATISAISGGASVASANALKIAIGAAAVGAVRIEANPTVISAVGGTSQITATAFDVNGNLMPSIPVSFTTDAGGVVPAVVNTDTNGKAQTTLTTTKVAKVTATAGLASTTPGTGTGTTPTATSPQSATVTVTVNAAPTIAVGAPSPAAPSVGQSVTFPLTYTADAAGSPVASVTVDFGDGSRPTTYPGKPASVSHTYTSIGSYSIRATVLDALGDTSSASGSVNVGALASITVGAPAPATPSVGQAVTFPLTYSATSSPIQRVVASFGDGTPDVTYAGTPSSVSHTYNVSGTFAMRVTAFDAFGNSSSGGASVQVAAKSQPAVSIVLKTTTPTAGTDTEFTASIAPGASSGTNITDANIDFGDGTPKQELGPITGTAISIHHTYLVGGTYTAVLTAHDTNGGTGASSTSVFVQTQTPLTVLLSASPTFGTTTTTVSFTATVIGLGNAVVVNYQWNFGDGNSQSTSSNQTTHTYPHPSSPVTVTVTITTSTGQTATGTTVVSP